MPKRRDSQSVPAKFPHGTYSLTLLGSKDWSKTANLFTRISNFESGFYFACQENNGGNAFKRKFN